MLDSLFSPITINKRQLKNRCIVPAMVMNLCEEDGSCTERFAAYHEAKAKGGFAMIITEDFAITNVAGKGHQYIGGLWKDEHIPGFKEYTDRLHKWGALSIVQLHHPGRQIGVIDKDTPWAPSAIPCPFSPDMMPHEMTVAEIKLVVKQFGQAAARAKAAGFDGCELHGAHGYLIEEFMSPYSNKRTDEYGGDLCNRMRFALEIIHEVREQTGPDFIIGYKLSSDEWVSGGLTIEDIYSFTTIVLGDIYTAFPGQDSVTVLIASLPAVVMMISAFASAFLLAKFNRKLLVIISMVIAVAAGLVVAYVEIPVAGIVACSALMGIPAGVVAAANASVLPSIAPDSLKDKVMGFHQAALMLGQTLFALICGFFARGGNWAGGFKTVYVIIPVIILVILFYPDIPVESVSDEKQEESKKLGNEEHHRMPTYAILLLGTYFLGCIFWNGWYLNNSDFIINEAQLGDTTLVGGVNSLCTAVSMIGCVAVSFWMKAFKGWSLPIALLIGGVCTFLPTVIPTIPCCYIAAIGCQLGIMIAISALQTYIGLGVKGKNLTTAMSFLQAFEGSGVFLCGYVVPFIASAFGESARHNMMVGAVATMLIGLATYTFMRKAHKQIFVEAK